jgi:hypothetical protein
LLFDLKAPGVPLAFWTSALFDGEDEFGAGAALDSLEELDFIGIPGLRA